MFSRLTSPLYTDDGYRLADVLRGRVRIVDARRRIRRYGPTRLRPPGRTAHRTPSRYGRKQARGGTWGLSHPLLKFSGGSVDDYATIPDDASSPS